MGVEIYYDRSRTPAELPGAFATVDWEFYSVDEVGVFRC